MLCYILQPNRQLLEIEIDLKQTGQVLLDKVLETLGILEVDYFGLKYQGSKKEELWLNLRNRLCDHEIFGSHNMYRLSLRVKFFVQPHLIQQECTKELFYAQAKDAMSKGLISLTKPDCDETSISKIVAAIVQAEHGDQTCNGYQQVIYFDTLKLICGDVEPCQSLMEKIHSEHSKLHGIPRASARYLMLKEACTLSGYGLEHHNVIGVDGAEVKFGVGPEGIDLFEPKTGKERKLPYSQIRLATHNDKMVNIELLDDAGESQGEESFKLVSRKAAVALYRCITEMHSFYRCDTVCSDVHSQYSRDFKGTFVSIFNEHSDLGKRYIFDIQRTSQEAYDFVRRKLYAKSSPNGSPIHSLYSSSTLVKDDDDDEADDDENNNGPSEDDLFSNVAAGGSSQMNVNKNIQKEVKQLKRRLDSIEDSLLCCICMYQKVSVVLCPCGHMTCDNCSERIEDCPQCRTSIERFQKVFHGFGMESNKVCKEESEV